MNRKLVLALVLTLLIGMLNVAFNVQRAKASGIIYIRADGSIDPPDAPISTVDNVTYTLTGNITSDGDGIVVERDNIVIDGADYTVQGTSRGTGTGIDLSVRINVTVRNIEITAFDCGIYLYDSSNNTIIRNNITNTNEGISLAGSSNNFIAENNITNNSYGIWLDYSLNNSMSGNNITNNYDGITLYHSSSNNVISENNITNNSDGNHLSDSSNNTVSSNTFLNDGLFVWSSYGNAVEDNIVNGKPLVYLEGVSNQTIENAGQVILVNCNNITVQNLNLFNTNTAIELWQTQKAKITNNSITNNCYGIYLQYSLNNNIYGNNVTDNQPYATGINLVHSSNNNIYGNNIRNNSWGVYLYNCSNNNIFGNSITDNGGSEVFGYGVCLAESSNNSICENNIRNNTYRGICLWQDSSNNTIYHNEFINNTSHVDLDVWTEVINIWDDGYPSGGNYWSDYTGVDEKSGPNQDLPGSDGIGDTPYIIDADNTDRYPLMVPKHELVVSVTSPIFLKLGSSSSLAAIVTNKGSSEETNVELRLIINGTITNSTIVPILQPSDSYTLNYLWTPTVEGIYNITAYAPPGPDEILIENNQQTTFVNVSAPEMVVSIVAPETLRLGASSSLKATVSNKGLSNETNVELWLIINGTIMNSTTISVLQTGDSYTLSFLWTPTVEGTYNVTAYALPVPGETSLENNHMTKFVTVTVPAPPSVQVGVKAGDWIKCDYTVTGWPSGTPYPVWLKVEFLSVERTNVTVRVTMRMSNGTEQNATVPVDVVAGGQAFGLSGFVIPANLTVGDVIYVSGYGNITIAGETTGTYTGVSRTVVYASISQYGTQLTYYWDKQTGVMVEASVVSGSVTATAKATETNMWQAAPSGLPIEPIYLYISAALVIIIVVGAAAFIERRKKKPAEEVESSQSKLRLTRAGFKRNFGHRITRV